MASTVSQGKPPFTMMTLLIRCIKSQLLEDLTCKITLPITLGSTGSHMMMGLLTKLSTGIIQQLSSKESWHSSGIGSLLQEDSWGQALSILPILTLMYQRQLFLGQPNIMRRWGILMLLLFSWRSFKQATFQCYGGLFMKQVENGSGGVPKVVDQLSPFIKSYMIESPTITISITSSGFGALLNLIGTQVTIEWTWLALTATQETITMIANTPCLVNWIILFKVLKWFKWQRMVLFPTYKAALGAELNGDFSCLGAT